MKKFSLHLSKFIPQHTKIKVYELHKDGQSLFQSFFEEAEKNPVLLAATAQALRIIEDTANLKLKPRTKFRPIVNSQLKCKLYEAKAKDVRIYLFEEEKTGRIIVLGGLKANQKKDIRKFIATVKAYQNEKTL